MATNRTRDEVADIIEGFMDDQSNPWAWDDFISFRIADPDLDKIREACNALPPGPLGQYTNAQGLATLRAFVVALRESPPSRGE
jgi:hypothetical protein